MATSLTYTTQAKFAAGNFKERIVDILADGTYSTSGYALAAADYSSLIGAPATQSTTQSISYILSFTPETNVGGVNVAFDRTNSKLLFFEAGAQATTTVSSKTVRCRVTHSEVNFK